MPSRNYSMLVVRSVTNAIKGQKLLESHGFGAYVERYTTSSANQGCGYALKIFGDSAYAARLLYQAGIKVVEILEG